MVNGCFRKYRVINGCFHKYRVIIESIEWKYNLFFFFSLSFSFFFFFSFFIKNPQWPSVAHGAKLKYLSIEV